MIQFGVIHATYREVHTMPDTVSSLHAAGVESVMLFPDSGVWGAFRNLDRALERLIEMQASHVCVVDDDLVIHPDTLILAEAFVRDNPNEAFTLYTVEQNVPHEMRERTGWIQFPVGWNTWGGMVVLPRLLAIELRSHPFWVRYRQTDKIGKQCDVAVFETLRLMGVPCWSHIPSLTTDNSKGTTTIGTTGKEILNGYKWNG